MTAGQRQGQGHATGSCSANGIRMQLSAQGTSPSLGCLLLQEVSMPPLTACPAGIVQHAQLCWDRSEPDGNRKGSKISHSHLFY